MRRAILNALRTRYEAEIAEADATINIYLDHPVAIGEHPQHIDEVNKLVDKIAFTGSTEVGKKIISQTSSSNIKLTMELGGKSPMIIFEDADLESATNGVLLSIFSASGQSCVAGSRLLLHENIHEIIIFICYE